MMMIGQTIYINQRRLVAVLLLIITSILVLYGFHVSDRASQNLKSQNFNQLIDLGDLLTASIDAANRGGLKVYEVRERASLEEKSKGETAEGANDPVTDGDMLSHIEMYHSIKNAFPTVTVISEEKTSSDVDNFKILPAKVGGSTYPSEYVDVDDIRIWIDPLDATQEYTENLRQYVTTMVCVAVKGVPIIGVIHKPFENYTAWAWVGKGHNTDLEVNKDEKSLPVPPLKIIVSRSHTGPVITQTEDAFGKDVKVTPAGGAGYKILEVVSGRQDAYIHSTLIKKWDICAGNAILNHLHGRLTTIQGYEIDYSSQIHYKNPDGLVATLYNHQFYLEKLK